MIIKHLLILVVGWIVFWFYFGFIIFGYSLQGHHQEIWCLAVSPSGDYVVSSSHDKSLRLWERTREPLILEEEKEMVRTSGLVGISP